MPEPVRVDLRCNICYNLAVAAIEQPWTKVAAREFQSFLLKKKISPADLEERIGIPRMTTWRWCNGKVKPSRMARRLLAERLGFKWRE